MRIICANTVTALSSLRRMRNALAGAWRRAKRSPALNLLSMVKFEPSDTFKPFGASDERFRVVQGNDQIAKKLAERANASLQTGAELERLRRNASGKFELYFKNAATPEIADAVVMTIPFSVLRNVVLEDNLDLSKQKRRAIAELRYGNNAKTMIAFEGRPWATEFRNNGETYADLPNVQNVWETNWTARGRYGVLTDFAGGDRGRRLQLGADGQPMNCEECHTSPGIPKEYPAPVQSQADEFLNDFDKIMPGTKAKAAKKDGIISWCAAIGCRSARHSVPTPPTIPAISRPSSGSRRSRRGCLNSRASTPRLSTKRRGSWKGRVRPASRRPRSCSAIYGTAGCKAKLITDRAAMAAPALYNKSVGAFMSDVMPPSLLLQYK